MKTSFFFHSRSSFGGGGSLRKSRINRNGMDAVSGLELHEGRNFPKREGRKEGTNEYKPDARTSTMITTAGDNVHDPYVMGFFFFFFFFSIAHPAHTR